jgi:hypothetical protein
MPVLEAHALSCEPINVRRNVHNIAAVGADGAAVEIVRRYEQNIHAFPRIVMLFRREEYAASRAPSIGAMFFDAPTQAFHALDMQAANDYAFPSHN